MQASAAPGGYAGAAPGFGAGGAYATSAGRVLAAKGGGIDVASIELPEKVRQAIEEKCERVRSYMVPDKPMREIDMHAMRVLEVDASIQAGTAYATAAEEFTFVLPEVAVPIHTCSVCGNKDQQFFVLDAKQGDTICMGVGGGGCGAVVEDHKAHEGNMYRQFEGEVDRSHHGLPPDKLYSTAYNMRTQISKGALDSARLANLSSYVEMNLSQMGKDDKRTRVGYKDQMKKQAFDVIDHMAANCDLHGTVTERAKELFAGWRNVKEHVHHKNAVICACIVAAYRTIAADEYRAREARRRARATVRQVLKCVRCGNVDAALFAATAPQPGRPSQRVCQRILSNGLPCGGLVAQTQVLEYPADDGGGDLLGPSADALHPFACRHCGARFNAARSRDVHEADCSRKIAIGSKVAFKGQPNVMYMVLEMLPDGEVRLMNLKTSMEQGEPAPIDQLELEDTPPADLPGAGGPRKPGGASAGPTAPMAEWGVSEARQWLMGVLRARKGDVPPVPAAHVEAICTELERGTAAEADVGDDGGGGGGAAGRAKRKRVRTAGQLLQTWSVQKFTAVCGGDAAAARVIHAEVGRKRAERAAAERSAMETKHARERRAQQVRKSWVNAIAAELQNGGR